MRIVPLDKQHLALIRLQRAQVGMRETVRDDVYTASLLESGPCYAGIDGGEVLICAGYIEHWENRAMMWALLADGIRNRMIAIHRAVQRAFTVHSYRRVETFVETNHAEAIRWVEMLGFVREGLMRAYLPDGSDAYLYARVK